MKLNVYISDMIYIQAVDKEQRACHPFFLEVKKALTHLNPQYDTLVRLRKFTGNTPRYTQMWKDVGKYSFFLAVPRGFEDLLRSMATCHNIELEAIDKTVYPELAEPIPSPSGTLDAFQEDAIQKLLKYDHGCIESPMGSGKGTMMLSMLPYLQTPTLILVHTTELFAQTHARISDWLGVDAGLLGNGKSRIKDITVGMIQTLARMNLHTSGIAKRFGCVIADEVHHAPSKTWSGILNQMQARYRYGFTATAWRKDKTEFMIWDVIGPIRCKVPKQTVIAAGRIVWPSIEQVRTEYFYNMNGPCQHEGERGFRRIGTCSEHPDGVNDPSLWGKMVTDLAGDDDRNELIEDTVRARMLPDTKALILTDRIEHANILWNRMHDLDPVLLTGELKKSERKINMEQTRAGAALTIATIHLLGEGVDVPGWSILFLVSPFSRGPRVMQALGRIARGAPNKDSATLIDFVDYRVPMLLGASRARMSLYRRK